MIFENDTKPRVYTADLKMIKTQCVYNVKLKPWPFIAFIYNLILDVPLYAASEQFISYIRGLTCCNDALLRSLPVSSLAAL